MKQFGWSEAKRYWEVHDADWASEDRADDPDALQNVIYPGKPLWFSRRWLGYVETAFEAMFDHVPPPRVGARALDVGCGAGWWSAFLAGRGYRAVGIDIQRRLIESNRRRFPNIEFHCETIQDYVPEEKFDLASSVMVIQHNPPDEQLMVAGKLRRLLVDGGHFIFLESIRETPDPFTYVRKIEGWKRLFEEAGFETLEIRRYHYNAFMRLGSGVLSVAKGPKEETRETLDMEEMAKIPEQVEDPLPLELFKKTAMSLDGRVEPILSRWNVPLDPYHCAFLFRAV